MYHTVKGLENAKLMRPAYAIEYDCIDPLHLKRSLASKLKMFPVYLVQASSMEPQAMRKQLLRDL